MNTPGITHLQALTLAIISAGEISGRDLRGRLAAHGEDRSGPVFYQLMARIEEAGLISGRYRDYMEGKQKIKERAYRITKSGSMELDRVREFYRTLPT